MVLRVVTGRKKNHALRLRLGLPTEESRLIFQLPPLKAINNVTDLEIEAVKKLISLMFDKDVMFGVHDNKWSSLWNGHLNIFISTYLILYKWYICALKNPPPFIEREIFFSAQAHFLNEKSIGLNNTFKDSYIKEVRRSVIETVDDLVFFLIWMCKRRNIMEKNNLGTLQSNCTSLGIQQRYNEIRCIHEDPYMGARLGNYIKLLFYHKNRYNLGVFDITHRKFYSQIFEKTPIACLADVTIFHRPVYTLLNFEQLLDPDKKWIKDK